MLSFVEMCPIPLSASLLAFGSRWKRIVVLFIVDYGRKKNVSSFTSNS